MFKKSFGGWTSSRGREEVNWDGRGRKKGTVRRGSCVPTEVLKSRCHWTIVGRFDLLRLSLFNHKTFILAARAAMLRQKYVRSQVPRWTWSMYSDIVPKKSEILPRFSTSVVFDSFWFRNKVTYRKSKTFLMSFDNRLMSSPNLM